MPYWGYGCREFKSLTRWFSRVEWKFVEFTPIARNMEVIEKGYGMTKRASFDYTNEQEK